MTYRAIWTWFSLLKCDFFSIVHQLTKTVTVQHNTWWRHQMETFFALLALCAWNSPVPGEFPARSPVARSFDVFLDVRLNKRLSKQSWCWWFETSSCPLWRHCNAWQELQFYSHDLNSFLHLRFTIRNVSFTAVSVTPSIEFRVHH